MERNNRLPSFALRLLLVVIVILSIAQIKLKMVQQKDDRIYEFVDSIFVGDTISAKEMIPDSIFEKDQIQRWKSEKPEIVSVDSISGVIASHESGSCDILGFIKQDTIVKVHVNVSPSKQVRDIKLTSITMNKEEIKEPLEPNKKVSIPITVEPKNALNKTLSWESSNNEVATVDNNGIVTTHKKGTTTISAMAKDGSGLKTSIKIEVKESTLTPQKNPAITLEKKIQSLAEGTSYKLKIKTIPQNVTIQWKSNNPSVASVDSKGKITAKKSGTVKITAIATTADGISAEDSIVIKVSAAPRPTEDVVKVVTQLNLGIGTYYGKVTNNKPDGGYIKMNNCTLTHRNGKKIVFTSGDKVDVNSYSQDPSSGRITIMGDITRVSGEIERNVMFFYYKD